MDTYKVITEWLNKNTKKKVIKESDQTANAVINLGGLAAGTGGIILRNKRQQALFMKIMDKFPHASDMIEFLKTQGKTPEGLTPEMSDFSYATWVKKNIVKQGRFFRIMCQVLLFGYAGGAYNILRWSAENGRDAEDSIRANYL